MIPPHLLRELFSSSDDYSSYLPLIYFIFFSACFLLFRLSQNFHIHPDTPTFNHANLDDRPSTTFSSLSIPFKLTLNSDRSVSVGLEMEFESYVDCFVQCFWGVQTNLLARITLSSNSNISGLADNISTELSSHSMSVEEPVLFTPGKHLLNLVPNLGLNLGPPPRKTVPLVVLCSVKCNRYSNFSSNSNPNSNCDSNSVDSIISDSNSTSNSNIAHLLTVLHIKDQHCREPSRKLNELIGLQNGQWLPLYRYYHGDETKLCVVCQGKQVSMILLPCRHACLCDSCSSHITHKCPMCRAFVTSVAVI